MATEFQEASERVKSVAESLQRVRDMKAREGDGGYLHGRALDAYTKTLPPKEQAQVVNLYLQGKGVPANTVSSQTTQQPVEPIDPMAMGKLTFGRYEPEPTAVTPVVAPKVEEAEKPALALAIIAGKPAPAPIDIFSYPPEQQDVLRKLEPYKRPDGGYNLEKAIYEKAVSQPEIETLYGAEGAAEIYKLYQSGWGPVAEQADRSREADARRAKELLSQGRLSPEEVEKQREIVFKGETGEPWTAKPAELPTDAEWASWDTGQRADWLKVHGWDKRSNKRELVFMIERGTTPQEIASGRVIGMEARVPSHLIGLREEDLSRLTIGYPHQPKIDAMKPYKKPDGTYDVKAAVAGGVPAKTVKDVVPLTTYMKAYHTRTPEGEDQYDISAALREGIPEELLADDFSAGAIQKAKEYNASLGEPAEGEYYIRGKPSEDGKSFTFLSPGDKAGELTKVDAQTYAQYEQWLRESTKAETQRESFAKLRDYQVLPTPEEFAEGEVIEGQYDTTQYLRDNNGSDEAIGTLVAAGYNASNVFARADAVRAITKADAWGEGTSVYVEKAITGGVTKGQLKSLGIVQTEMPPVPEWAKAPFRIEHTWENIRTGEVITQAELLERFPKGYEPELDDWRLSRESSIQLMKDAGTVIKGAVMRIPHDIQLLAKMRSIRNSDPDGKWDYRNPNSGEVTVITTAERDKILEDYTKARMAYWMGEGEDPGSPPDDLITVHMTPDEKRALLEMGLTAISVPLALAPVPVIPAASAALARGLSLIPRMAANMVMHMLPKAPAFYTVAAMTEGARTADLERKWGTFQALPKERQDYWAKLAGFNNFDGLTDLEKASVLIRYQMPATVTMQEWTAGIGEVLEGAQARVQQLNQFYREKLPAPAAWAAATLTWFGEGALVEAPAYVFAIIPMTVAEVADQAPEGNAVPYALATAAAFAMFFKNIPEDVRKDPTRLGFYTGLFMGPKATAKLFVKSLNAIKDAPNLRMLDKTALALQPDVNRVVRPQPEVREGIVFPTAQPVSAIRGMTFAQARELIQGAEFTSELSGKVYRGEAALRQAALEAQYMPHRVKVEIPSIGKAILYKSALQTVLDRTFWHGSPKTTDFIVDPMKGYIETPAGKLTFFSPQFPQSFMAGDAISPPIFPGGLAARFSFNDISWELPKSVQRILEKPAKTEIEAFNSMQAARQEMYRLAETGQLESGKFYGLFKEYGFGVSFNEVGVPIIVGTPKLELEVVATPKTKLYSIEPAKYAPSTFKTEQIVNRKVTTPASELEITTPQSVKEVGGVLLGDKFDAQGGLIETAKPYIHPEIGGRVRRRVTAVVTGNDATQFKDVPVEVAPATYDIVTKLMADGTLKRGDKVLLVTDRTEPRGHYGLPGGDMYYEQLFPGALEAKQRYPVEAFADAQVFSETNIGTDVGATKRLPSYLGQMNRHSLPGSYVRLLRATNTDINIWQYLEGLREELKGREPTAKEFRELQAGPEVKDAIWWEVNPDNLRISSKTPAELITARDTSYYKPQSLSVGGVQDVVQYIPERKAVLIDYNTAVTETRSWISQPEIQGYGIQAGQKIPIVWLRTEAARAEGLGLPTPMQVVKIKALTPLVNAFKSVFLNTVKRRMAKEGEPATTETVGYEALQLKDYKRVVKDTLNDAEIKPEDAKLGELERARSLEEARRATNKLLDDVAEDLGRRVDERVSRGEVFAKAESDVVFSRTRKLADDLEVLREAERFLPYRGEGFTYRPTLAIEYPFAEREVTETPEERLQVSDELRFEAVPERPLGEVVVEAVVERPPESRAERPLEPTIERPTEGIPEELPERPPEEAPEPRLEPVPERPLERPPEEPPPEEPPPYESPPPPLRPKDKEYEEQVAKIKPGTVCFPIGTKVLVERKYYPTSPCGQRYRKRKLCPTTKPIEHINIGDKVLSYNEDSGRKEFKTITQIFCRDASDFVTIVLSNGNQFKCTPDHPIAVVDSGALLWKSAQDLAIGDELIQYKYSGLNSRMLCLSGGRQREIAKSTISARRGRSLEAIFGIDIAQKIKSSVSHANKGKPSPIRGMTIVEAYGEEQARRMKQKQGLARMGNTNRLGYKTPAKTKRLISLHHADMKGKNNPFYGKKHTEESLRKQLESCACWREANPEKVIQMVTFSHNRANKSEIKLSYIMRHCVPREYKYNGNGNLGVVVGGMIPDFWNVNGKKKVIELFGEGWHNPSDEDKRKARYKACGVDCLVIWLKELRNQEAVKQKIKTFTYNPNVELVRVVDIIHHHTEPSKVYNLEVEDNNNYFTYGVLVHNCWVQGNPTYRGGTTAPMYKILPPPYRQEDFFTMRQTPPGYKETGITGKGSARKTLQVIGGVPAADIENIDLGWARVNLLRTGSGNVEIEYVHDEEANVGAREQTIGMGEGQIPIDVWKEAKAQGITKEELAGQYTREAEPEKPTISQGKGLVKESEKLVKPSQRLLPERTYEEAETKEVSEPKPEPVAETTGEEVIEAEIVKPEFNVVWVDSWRDIPAPDVDSGVKAYRDADTDTIYAIKNVTTPADIEHEKYHSLQGYTAMPNDPAEYVGQELAAHKYAYDNVSEPKHILGRLRAMFNELVGGTYRIKPHRAITLIDREFGKNGLPDTWKSDFARLRSEFDQLYGRMPSGALVRQEDLLLPQGYRMVGGGNRLLRSAVAMESGGEGEDADRIRKRLREKKNWWEDEAFYGNQADMVGVGTRYYRGRPILPPDLGGVV